MTTRPAVLLLGPTGSGKSPLGDLLAARGLCGRRCVHLDFGALLRRVADHGGAGLGPEIVAFVRDLLRENRLLEDDSLPIARAILASFLFEQGVVERGVVERGVVERGVGAEDLVVLNGLPRHTGQARDLVDVFDIVLVVELDCSAATVRARIASNRGGDRAERVDDSSEEIERKLRTYAERTRPLLEHYRARGVPCRRFEVGEATTAGDVLRALTASQPSVRTRGPDPDAS
ncbi:MAG: nucleoside monophosphate kinase [Planctomycetes bacterium]|nr:nucleoside monophosphate kinase [Planctomycetota bacterium]